MSTLSLSLKKLIPLLPRHAEEGHLSTSVKKSVLQDKLIESGLSIDVLELIERLLCSVATLDTLALQQGEWRFVSFAAQLLAHSLLHTLADEQQLLLDSHFWEMKQHDNEVDLQYNLLHELETNRVRFHRQHNAAAIRFIYVAWVMIKVNGQFLLHRREDNRIRDGKGEYVLIGGRANVDDLEDVVPELSIEQRLHLLQEPLPDLLEAMLANTLRREIQEEIGLFSEQDYTVKPWRILKPYFDVAGTRANHAYTEYHIHVFSLHLTQSGFFKLCQAEQANQSCFKRFSLAELVSGRTTDGKTAYLDALYTEYPNKKLLTTDLEDVPEALPNQYRFNENVILPVNIDKPLEIGGYGEEKPVDFILSRNQGLLLCALAAHAKGFEFDFVKDGVKLLGCGWVKVSDETIILALLELAEYLRTKAYPLVEIEFGCYFRLSVNPISIIFDTDVFVSGLKCLNNSSWNLTVEFNQVDTPLGLLASRSQFVTISSELKQRWDELKNDDGDELAFIGNIEPEFRRIGLHKLLQENDKIVLFGDLVGSTALYNRLGDDKAHALIKKRLDLVKEYVVEQQGSVVKHMGDGIMVVFRDSKSALDAGLKIIQEFAKLNKSAVEPLLFKLGLHKGACIVSLSNEQLDYFGNTINIAARIQDKSQGNDLVVSEVLFQEVSSFLAEDKSWNVSKFVAELKGIEEEQTLYRVSLDR